MKDHPPSLRVTCGQHWISTQGLPLHTGIYLNSIPWPKIRPSRGIEQELHPIEYAMCTTLPLKPRDRGAGNVEK